MNANRIYIRSITLGLLTLAATGCNVSNQTVPQDGVVKFSVDGNPYTITSLQFEIQPNNVGDSTSIHKEVIPIKKGKNDFGFWIDATQTYRESFHGDAGAIAKVNWLEISCFAETDDPIEFLKTASKITAQNIREPVWDIEIPAAQIQYQTHIPDANNIGQWIDQSDGWIQFDEVSEDRVKGHFGGSVFAHPPGNALQPRTTQVTDGQFDLPVVKLYKYE